MGKISEARWKSLKTHLFRINIFTEKESKNFVADFEILAVVWAPIPWKLCARDKTSNYF